MITSSILTTMILLLLVMANLWLVFRLIARKQRVIKQAARSNFTHSELLNQAGEPTPGTVLVPGDTVAKPLVSIIIPCKNEDLNLKKTIDNIRSHNVNTAYEIIVVNDGSEDQCCDFLSGKDYQDLRLILTSGVGAAGARNTGAEQAQGDILVFCDAHVAVCDNWLDGLVASLREHRAQAVCPAVADMKTGRTVGYGQTWNRALNVSWLQEKPAAGTEVPLAGGCALAVEREVFGKIGGFDRYFQVWGREDEEICLKLWLFGYRLVVEPSVVVQHLFRSSHPYRVTNNHVIHNLLCLAYSHFNRRRLAKTIDLVKTNPYFPALLSDLLLHEGLREQRRLYLSTRVYDDNYYFDKFKISF
ncbi:glycosyltransferase [Desulforamulus hydrothermalis]|uniref:Glycosyl transferase family 2 n=1 Tax=Desulforamulus hydrothermalis Lam5 = DSM 18033 TaxID=1121428 RepID=K8DZL5_9FIRM|nr:glycosyltransferase [Desulforamulus hydrothermalis]CCO08549.1 Glycosyl transferase family 2 [Desulforamulus hydrothermalis Lam5 = DSM 18033]SHH02432.1 Glycosyl transferase family 2 [Desulforamulus hydrothermalis Lam5 = DSM 18033]